ncbi:replicative DNA helicase [Candidatus Saccharibacteria bacterium]|nr:replicative DNA helicase [Candidatus Saccharibacteria bacterium]
MAENRRAKDKPVPTEAELRRLTPANSPQAERSLLGAILLDSDTLIRIADIVTSDDFYEQRHSLIFEQIIKLYEQRKPIDLVTLSENLTALKQLDLVGGISYLTELANAVPSSTHAPEYAKIVAGKATLRRLDIAGHTISGLAHEEERELEDLLDEAERSLFTVSQKHLKQNFISIKDVLADSFDRLDALHKDKKQLRGVPTGFKEMDNLLAGLQKSDLIILAARPSMGKTSFVMNIAAHVAIKEGIPVGIFSLEMSKEQLIDRLLASESGIDSWKLRTGNLEDKDFEKLNRAMGIMAEAPIFIDDSAMTNSLEMRTKARRLQAEHGLGLIIIDYLQLMSGKGGGSENRVNEISEISRSLKALAREVDVPVIALSQLSRAVEQRHPQIPQLSDLRESGSIEQDADVVMFIYREDYYNKESERKNIADVLVRKHRNGPTGDVELFFSPELMLFRSLDSASRRKTSLE